MPATVASQAFVSTDDGRHKSNLLADYKSDRIFRWEPWGADCWYDGTA